MTTNYEFLTAIFNDEYKQAHVTDFEYDPGDIPDEYKRSVWFGRYYTDYKFNRFSDQTNQYFTISLFDTDEKGAARRKKSLYRKTCCIVLDDVKEKLSETEALKLPTPSWILETSPGSEQWGYILIEPCTSQVMADNLLDGLVHKGLAPDGKDPGMKGVTRYVRLPEGYNTKKKKMVDGQPFKCRMLSWNPFQRVTIEQLAEPFQIDLHAVRRETRVDGAADIPDHPLLGIDDIVTVKEVRSAGRFDITCPWVNEHTNAEDSGTAVFTNDDGTIGFKCHHGACQERTGKDLLDLIETVIPDFRNQLSKWQAIRAFDNVTPLPVATDTVQTLAEPASQLVDPFSQLRRLEPGSPESMQAAEELLKIIDKLPAMERIQKQEEMCDIMGWSKQNFKVIIGDLHKTWYTKKKKAIYDDFLFVREMNSFYQYDVNMVLTPEAFQNGYADIDPEIRANAIIEGMVQKVDRLNFAPRKPLVFTEGQVTFGNLWIETSENLGMLGDVTPWLHHWDRLGWSEHRDHMLKWMAYTIMHPEKKINHMLLLGGKEGVGKDFLLYPLTVAMGRYCKIISGEALLSDFQEYLVGTKYLHINEAELGDHRDAKTVSNKLKPLSAAPPMELRANIKKVSPITINNIVNATMGTNSRVPIQLNGVSRRFYAVWSDLNTRDEYHELLPFWRDYWMKQWEWMIRGRGADCCIWYLRNCVDISNFNPAAAPPMTEFLRDIQNSSRHPVETTIEAFIEEAEGVFISDIITVRDAVNTLKSGNIFSPGIIHCDSRFFTPQKVETVFKDMTNITKLKDKFWAVRNADKYKNLTEQQLKIEYERQKSKIRQAGHLKIC